MAPHLKTRWLLSLSLLTAACFAALVLFTVRGQIIPAVWFGLLGFAALGTMRLVERSQLTGALKRIAGP